MVEALVYKLTSPSGKSYIGVTTNLPQRIVHHSWNSHTYIGKAIRKYGPDKFTIETLFEGSLDDCFVKEMTLIAEYNTLEPHGYNLVAGGQGGSPISPALREKLCEIQKRIWSDPKHRAKRKALFQPSEVRSKMSAKRKKEWPLSRREAYSDMLRTRWMSQQLNILQKVQK